VPSRRFHSVYVVPVYGSLWYSIFSIPIFYVFASSTTSNVAITGANVASITCLRGDVVSNNVTVLYKLNQHKLAVWFVLIFAVSNTLLYGSKD